MKNILIGFFIGIMLVFALGTTKYSNPKYQSTLCSQTNTPYFLYTVLNTDTGETRVMLLDTTPRTVGAPVNNPPLICKSGSIDEADEGAWHYSYK